MFLQRADLADHLALVRGLPAPIVPIGDPDGTGHRLVFPLVDGERAFAKSNTADHPFMCINDWIGATVGTLAGFSMLPVAQIAWGGETYVGWPYFQRDEFVPDPSLGYANPAYQACSNALELPYQAVALDALLANADRHDQGNVFVVTVSKPELAISAPHAYLIDHDRSCFHHPTFPQRGEAGIVELARDCIDGWDQGITAWIREDASWRNGVLDRGRLDLAVQACEALTDADLQGVIDMAPASWVSEPARALLFNFLVNRRDHLPAIVNARVDKFPHLR